MSSVSSRGVGLKIAVKAITNEDAYHREDDFLKRLAEELFLDEVLAGEYDPVEFLRESLNKVVKDIEIHRQEVKLSKMKGEI
jgi:hypothetical protein